MSTTFIQRHGHVQYSAVKWPPGQYPLVRRCEICRSPGHRAYVFDHCHAHGWVRGILCTVCNTHMSRVDEGKVHTARHLAYQAQCPDCIVRPPTPRLARPPQCPRCKGCGFIWSVNFRRMFACPACQAVTKSEDVTLSDGQRGDRSANAANPITGPITESDSRDSRKRQNFSAPSARSSGGAGTVPPGGIRRSLIVTSPLRRNSDCA